MRNDTHFAGCTTDSERIERLKEALRKAGMKGTALSFLLRPLPVRFCFSPFSLCLFPHSFSGGFCFASSFSSLDSFFVHEKDGFFVYVLRVCGCVIIICLTLNHGF